MNDYRCNICARPISKGSTHCTAHRLGARSGERMLQYYSQKKSREKKIDQLRERRSWEHQKRFTQLVHILIAKRSGMTYEEIAQELGTSKQRVHYLSKRYLANFL